MLMFMFGANICAAIPPPPPPPPPAPAMGNQVLSYKQREEAKRKEAQAEAERKLQSAASYLKTEKILNNPDFAYINENLREDCKVNIEVLELKADDNLSLIQAIIDKEKASGNITNDQIAVFFDFDNTVTRSISPTQKDVLLPEHVSLLNGLTNNRVDWGIITASKAEGPKYKYQKMVDNGIRLEAPSTLERYQYLPTILLQKGNTTDLIERNGSKFDLATIEYISYGDNIILAALPDKNNQFVDGTFVYNRAELVARHNALGYGSGDGYQKPAAMRYYLNNRSKKKLIIVVDDNPRNIMDFVNDAEAKLLGKNVYEEVKLIAIWYQPTKYQTTEYVEFADDLRRTHGMQVYQH